METSQEKSSRNLQVLGAQSMSCEAAVKVAIYSFGSKQEAHLMDAHNNSLLVLEISGVNGWINAHGGEQYENGEECI